MGSINSIPPEMPLDMPRQDLHTYVADSFPTHCSWWTHAARWIAFVGAFIIGSVGTWKMWTALGGGYNSFLEILLLLLFSLTFYWVSFSFTSAVTGWLPQRRYHRALSKEGGKVALLMPVYNEDPSRTCSALLAMAEQIANTAIKQRCEIFILSDTQEVDVWVAETCAFDTLRRRAPLPVWYRRRTHNIGRKSGNIEDFVKRWGGRYDYMLILDADSLMQGNAVESMVASMDSDARLGLLQTVPRLIGGQSVLARIIQFSSALYGKHVARGVSAWQGEDGNYWGHNAMIRVEAFAQSCGLPMLEGRPPIGGYIMSHDFVEAAFMRRAGWIVRMDADLQGSYEGLPPTLGELSSRERRWAQGNLQHIGIIAASGLRWVSRVHFIIGIASYLMSPIWLLMLIVGMLITAQALFSQPQYFPIAYQLFPNWPTFDAHLMFILFCVSIFLLLAPKLMSFFSALIFTSQRRAFGGFSALVKSFSFELIMSMLYAPMLMLMQTHHITDILWGRDSGWEAQNRTASLIPWKIALRHTIKYVIWGAIPLAVLIWLAPNQIIWLSIVIAGMLLSPWLARHSGNIVIGKWLAQHNFLLIPEEINPPVLLRNAIMYRDIFVQDSQMTFAHLAKDRRVAQCHIVTLSTPEEYEERRLLRITATAKLKAARNFNEAVSFLTEQEKLLVAGCTDLIRLLQSVET